MNTWAHDNFITMRRPRSFPTRTILHASIGFYHERLLPWVFYLESFLNHERPTWESSHTTRSCVKPAAFLTQFLGLEVSNRDILSWFGMSFKEHITKHSTFFSPFQCIAHCHGVPGEAQAGCWPIHWCQWFDPMLGVLDGRLGPLEGAHSFEASRWHLMEDVSWACLACLRQWAVASFCCHSPKWGYPHQEASTLPGEIAGDEEFRYRKDV